MIPMQTIIEQETQKIKIGWLHFTLLVTMIPETFKVILMPWLLEDHGHNKKIFQSTLEI